jgi:gamma-glutamyltranspeptidase/glutathione hydrolase
VSFTTRPELSGTFGAVASTHWLASSAGMAVLEHGGNAFDAAVAAGLVLQVVEPHLNGPGGDLPVVAWSAWRGEPFVVCGQGVAPAAASVERLRDELGLDAVPGTGLLAACVPGAFDAWMRLLLEYGTLRLGEVMGYAIGCAADGFPTLDPIAAAITGVEQLFASEWTSSAELWLSRGSGPRPGTRLRNPALAETYGRIVVEAESAGRDRDAQIEHARAAWRSGWVAEAIVDFIGSTEVLDSSGRRHRGLLAEADLASWRATIEPPVTFNHRGHTICKTGPWGQGPVLLQQLALLADIDIAALGRDEPEYVHTVIEAAKLAFADREAFYGDAPGLGGDAVPLEALLSPGYNDERRTLIGTEASLELRAGAPEGVPPRLPVALRADPGRAVAAGLGEPTRGDTCHLDVADRHGNIVSATPSGGWLQSSPAIPGLGFCLGTRAQMFWLEEGLPSSLVGKTRPRTTLSPSLALRDGQGFMGFGTPGGDQQDQWSLGFLLSCADFGMNLQEAIDAPAFGSTHFPSSFHPRVAQPGRMEIESRAGEEVVAGLRERGHEVAVAGPWSLGRLSAVSRGPDGVLRAAANPRGMQGYAMAR